MEMKRLGTNLAAKLQLRQVKTEAQGVNESTESNESNGGLLKKAGVIALGTIALAGAATAVPAPAEAGGNAGAFLLWGFGLGMLTNPCMWNYCGPVYPQPYPQPYPHYPPVQMRGPWHYGPTNLNPWGEWHFHDNMGHYYGG